MSLDDLKPVTRGELRQELAAFEHNFDLKLEKLEQKLEQKFDQKFELWTGAILARMDELHQRSMAELARHVQTIESSWTTRLAVVDEKYDHLPRQVAADREKQAELEQRVVRLEGAVFPPAPQRRRRAPRRG